MIETALKTFREERSISDDTSEAVRCATAYIHDQLFVHDLTVTKMREACALNESTFAARFRRHHGLTPGAYIRHLRVEAAKKLLHYDAIRIADIAFYVGYKHYRTFARVFKRMAGCSPQAFREEVQAS